jgi:phospholipid/cholesterol/gamma-HCH transport system substrate-binding protein
VGNPVEMLGIEIGQVENLEIDQKNQVAVVTLRIKKGINLYDDAMASIKTAGLIGDRYISIDPGGGGEILKPGESITETESPVDIEELVKKYAFGEVKK